MRHCRHYSGHPSWRVVMADCAPSVPCTPWRAQADPSLPPDVQATVPVHSLFENTAQNIKTHFTCSHCDYTSFVKNEQNYFHITMTDFKRGKLSPISEEDSLASEWHSVETCPVVLGSSLTSQLNTLDSLPPPWRHHCLPVVTVRISLGDKEKSIVFCFGLWTLFWKYFLKRNLLVRFIVLQQCF